MVTSQSEINNTPMSKREYASVPNDDVAPKRVDEDHKKSWDSWKPFLRQLQISSCTWTIYFQLGLCFGAPTVIIARMREEHGEQYITRDMASWISSAMMYASVPWAPIIVLLAAAIGRRYTFALGVMANLVGFAMLCASHTPVHVLIGMIVQGPLAASTMTITLFVLTEYTSPVYRGIFLTIKSATGFWGIWAANVIGTVTHWHYIAWLGLACSVYNLLSFFLWPESPYWLASKGRLEQCREAHRWLKGNDQRSEKELCELIDEKQPVRVEGVHAENKETLREKLRKIFIVMKSKCFYKTLLINATLVTQYHLSGKFVCSIYAIDIIRDITKSKEDAYKGMLILDGVTVLGMYVGCGLSKKLTRRMLLISAGGAGSVFLLIMSVYLFLIRHEVVSESKYVTISLLTFYSLLISCGPIILNSGLGAELLPLRLRGTAATIVGMFAYIVGGTTVKVTPYIFAFLGIDATFFLYGLMSGSLLVVLYIFLPETKDKTLNEIQDLILGIKSDHAPESKNLM